MNTPPHILVVEDEEHLATGIKYNLVAEGYGATAVGDGRTALATWEEQPEGVDLVVLDLMLPGTSGYAVCESIREFVGRIRQGATQFLLDRGVVRSDVALPVWQIAQPGARIALVAHAGTNSVTIGHLLGLEPTPWEWDRFVLGHSSVSRVEALPLDDGFTFSLTKLSDLEHLDRTDRTR